MKVRYSIAITGRLRVQDAAPISLGDWSFEFQANEKTGYVERMVLEIANVESEHWPTITQIKQPNDAKIPVFPFVVNPKVLRFRTFEPHLINLESYLSVFGLEELDLSSLKEEWLPEGDEEHVPMQSGFSLGPRSWEDLIASVTFNTLVRCIVASNKSDPETTAFAYYRLAQLNFHAHRYIETVRQIYTGLSPGRKSAIAFDEVIIDLQPKSSSRLPLCEFPFMYNNAQQLRHPVSGLRFGTGQMN